MKYPPLPTLLLASLMLPASAQLTPIFSPDFSGSYIGTGDNQFNWVGSAESGTFATTSVVGNRYQMVTNFDTDSSVNVSATRLSRSGSSSPWTQNQLPFVDNFGTISLNFRFDPLNAWLGSDSSLLNIVIGQNFRTGAFNPARGSPQLDGPSFASLNLQARTTEGQFRFIAGGGPGSNNFNVAADEDGFHNIAVFAAFNNSGSAQTFTSPTGTYELNHFSIAIWANGVLVWDNYTSVTNIRNANFEHVSFGLGNGTNTNFTNAQQFAGTYQLDSIVAQTMIPEPSQWSWIAAALILSLLACKRRKS